MLSMHRLNVNQSPTHLIRLQETDSTNRYLKELLETEPSLADETIVFTDFQTAGRGQPGNSWESEAGQNLTFSLLYIPSRLAANEFFRIAEIAALSVKQLLDKHITDVTVKWPNDVYWKNKKICGMLIENFLGGKFISHSLIGLGININQQLFRSNAPNPVSLTQITGKQYSRIKMLEEWHSGFRRLRGLLETNHAEQIHEAYIHSLYRRDGYHLYEDASGRFEAQIRHIETDGHLILERRDGTCSRYAFKEVSFI